MTKVCFLEVKLGFANPWFSNVLVRASLLLWDTATYPYALSCPLSLTSDPVLGWSMIERSLATCSGSWLICRHIEFEMAPNFAQNRRILFFVLLLFNLGLSI